MPDSYHIPVMPTESIEALSLFPGAYVVDATFGGGGHTGLILKEIGEGKVFAFDQDEDAAGNVPDDDRLFFVRHNFRYLKNFLRYFNVDQVDAVFADLGVSSHDFDVANRGFSFRFDGQLDMRMNREAPVDASQVLNSYTEEQLRFMFRMYGELKNAGKLVREILKEREQGRIDSTVGLREIALRCAPGGSENKYLAQVFQALRLEVNDELEALKEFLQAARDVLKPGGRLAVITYHSLEDRLCKNFMKTGNFEGTAVKDFYGNITRPFNIINRKVITPKPHELSSNARSRSAKLRIAEKIK